MSKICCIRGCKRKVPKTILNNPKGESLCAMHHGFQVRLEDDRIKCTIIGCDNMAYSSGLCKNHTHSPHEPRMDLRIEHATDREAKLQSTIGSDVLPIKKRLDTLQMNDFDCLYCGDSAHSSMGPSPPHCCPICWNKIERC